MKISFYQLGWKTLWRDLRAGELRLLLVAVTLAVAALTAVGFFADRIKGGLQRDAKALLGGDIVLSGDNPTPQTFKDKATALGLQSATSIGFPTMARANDAQGGASKLVALKAVSGGYPLRGSLKTATAPDTPEIATRDLPSKDSAWVDASLLDALSLKVGDQLLLGNSTLKIERIIVIEPDRGAGFMNFAPRVMLHSDALAATGLVQPASRITYRTAMVGENAAVKAYSGPTRTSKRPTCAACASSRSRVAAQRCGKP
jgi:putative ABC transport system permease protein